MPLNWTPKTISGKPTVPAKGDMALGEGGVFELPLPPDTLMERTGPWQSRKERRPLHSPVESSFGQNLELEFQEFLSFWKGKEVDQIWAGLEIPAQFA